MPLKTVMFCWNGTAGNGDGLNKANKVGLRGEH